MRRQPPAPHWVKTERQGPHEVWTPVAKDFLETLSIFLVCQRARRMSPSTTTSAGSGTRWDGCFADWRASAPSRWSNGCASPAARAGDLGKHPSWGWERPGRGLL